MEYEMTSTLAALQPDEIGSQITSKTRKRNHWAHAVLDDVRSGHPVSIHRIKHALRILGDLT